MKYNVLQYVVNTQGQYLAQVVATYGDVNGAKVKYHQLLATLHNASDVETASVVIVDTYGRILNGFIETVDHTPADTQEN
jgi:hypothetical protein